MSENEARKEVALVPQLDTGNALVPQQSSSKAVVVEVDDQVRNLGDALLQLSTAIKSIAPDDLSFEFSQDNTAERSTTRLKLRAYRKVG
jgi:hypothetical protein